MPVVVQRVLLAHFDVMSIRVVVFVVVIGLGYSKMMTTSLKATTDEMTFAVVPIREQQPMPRDTGN